MGKVVEVSLISDIDSVKPFLHHIESILIFHSDWVLKTDQGLDGDSLSYLDSMERSDSEERKRARERQLMEEGRSISL